MYAARPGFPPNATIRPSIRAFVPSLPGAAGLSDAVPTASRCYAVRLSRKSDLFSLHCGLRLRGQLRVAAAYKKKADKVRPVNAASKDGSKPEGLRNWKEEVWRKMQPIPKDPTC